MGCIFSLPDSIVLYLKTVGATYQTGADVTVRAQFINNGRLPNTQDTAFRAIQDNWPVFGLAHDLGSVTGASAPVVFSVGHIRDPAIKYIVAGGGTQSRSLYFWSQFSTSASLVRFTAVTSKIVLQLIDIITRFRHSLEISPTL